MSEDEIDALMKGPVRKMPSIVVVGDDDVIGYTPAPPPEPISFEQVAAPRRGLLRFWPFGR